jgi:hypothetical protein
LFIGAGKLRVTAAPIARRASHGLECWERVFAAWTDPAKLQRWTGCKDATNVVCESDFREGGSFTTKTLFYTFCPDLKAAGLNHWFGVPNTIGPLKFGFRNDAPDYGYRHCLTGCSLVVA